MKLNDRIEELLKEHNNDQYDKLWLVCKKIIKDVNHHNTLITAQMSNYDIHDCSHSEQVIFIIENLLGNKINELTCYEAILLYMSAFLHDSAMALPEWEYNLLKAVEGTDEFFDNTLSFLVKNDFKGEHSFSEALAIIEENKKELFEFDKSKEFVFAKESEQELLESLAKLMREYELFRNGYHAELEKNKQTNAAYMNMSKLIRSEFIRATHHERVVDNIKSLKKEIEGAIGSFAADNFIRDLSEICKCHGEQLSALFELPMEREDLLGEKSNIQFLAMLLRLGDVIHFSSDRAPMSLFAEKRITDETSFMHWSAKFQDLKFKIEERNGIINVKYAAFCSTPEVYYFIQGYMDWIDGELDNYFVLKQNWEQAKLDKLNNYSLSISNRVDRTQLSYDQDVFIPKKNMHFVLNQSKILELLMGLQLYKDEFLCLRELYQNALDATKCIIAINNKKGSKEELSIEFGLGEEMIEGTRRKYLYCLDHGTGMNQYIVNNFLLHIGNSYYKSKDFHRKNTGWGFEVNPTSQFGIGILSGYMMADRIGITTAYYETCETMSFVLEGINENFYYINPSELDKERIGAHGTIVKLYLKDEFIDINNEYIEKLPVLLGKHKMETIKKYVDPKVFLNNLHYIINKHICVAYDEIAVNVRCEDNELHPIIQCNSILNLRNYPAITAEDLHCLWEETRFFGGELNPYLEVIERLDYIENYNINLRTDNLELYSYISFPKKGMDKENLYYYYLFDFVGEKSGSLLVDGIYVEDVRMSNNNLMDFLDYDLSRSAIINFVGEKRPGLSVDRNSCVSMPAIDEDVKQLKRQLIEKIVDIVSDHIKSESIKFNDNLLSEILNITVLKFPSLADKIFERLCDTPLGDANVPKQFNLDAVISIKELMQNHELVIQDIDFRKYEEVYRRILIGKLVNAEAVVIDNNTMSIQSKNYCELPVEKYRIHEREFSISTVAIKADKWNGEFEEYDLVSNMWPIVNPKLFDALHAEHTVKSISNRCKRISDSGNGIQGIARLNPTLINPKYGIGLEQRTYIGRKGQLISNPDSIANNFWLFELTNFKKDTFEEKKGASLFAYIAPRVLTEEEQKVLREYEGAEEDFVKGVKEGWSILFISNGSYIIMPGVVTRQQILKKIPAYMKTEDADISYYATDGTKLF